MRDTRFVVARAIAAAFVAGDWEPLAMARRGQRAVGQRRVWLRDLALAARHAYPVAPLDRTRELATFLAACTPFTAAFERAGERGEAPPRVQRWYLARTAMGPTRWPVAPLASIADVQDLIGFRIGDLSWLADRQQREGKVHDERLRHYRYSWRRKRSGGARLIEEPKPLLKHVQRVILREVINRSPSTTRPTVSVAADPPSPMPPLTPEASLSSTSTLKTSSGR